jgi:hypothetical protein
MRNQASNGSASRAGWIRVGLAVCRLHGAAIGSAQSVSPAGGKGKQAAPGREVRIHLAPGEDRNAVDPRSRGDLPAAVLGSPAIDAADLDPGTLRLEGVPPLKDDAGAGIGSSFGGWSITLTAVIDTRTWCHGSALSLLPSAVTTSPISVVGDDPDRHLESRGAQRRERRLPGGITSRQVDSTPFCPGP